MTGPDDAIPVIPSTDSREPELERAIRRGSFLGRVADFVGRGWIAIRKSVVAAAPVLLVLAAAIGGWWGFIPDGGSADRADDRGGAGGRAGACGAV